MAKQEIVEVVLDVTVSPQAWNRAHGSDPVADLPVFVAESVRGAAPRLPASADVTLSGAAVASATAEWVTMRIVLDVRLEGGAWLTRWGVPAHVAVGPHVAAFLAALPSLAENATVVCVQSGRVLADYRYRTRD